MADLDQLLARFPEHAREIRRMCLQDPNFRSICDDLALAYRSLNSPRPRRDAGMSPDMQELGVLRTELEAELIRYLDRGRETGGSRL